MFHLSESVHLKLTPLLKA